MEKRALLLVAGAGVGLAAPTARAKVYVNELLGSTAAEDAEFIELHNTGIDPVDLTGWTIELWDSDAGPTLGTHDADSPIRLGGSIDGGGYFLLANKRFSEVWEIEPDLRVPNNSIENSSYTLVLKDGFGTIVETIFVSDRGEGDTANIGGRAITPDAVIEAPGRFIPPGFARTDDGTEDRAYRVLEFSPVPIPSATPGEPNTSGPGTTGTHNPAPEPRARPPHPRTDEPTRD